MPSCSGCRSADTARSFRQIWSRLLVHSSVVFTFDDVGACVTCRCLPDRHRDAEGAAHLVGAIDGRPVSFDERSERVFRQPDLCGCSASAQPAFLQVCLHDPQQLLSRSSGLTSSLFAHVSLPPLASSRARTRSPAPAFVVRSPAGERVFSRLCCSEPLGRRSASPARWQRRCFVEAGSPMRLPSLAGVARVPWRLRTLVNRPSSLLLPRSRSLRRACDSCSRQVEWGKSSPSGGALLVWPPRSPPPGKEVRDDCCAALGGSGVGRPLQRHPEPISFVLHCSRFCLEVQSSAQAA